MVDNNDYEVYVQKRPGVDTFLKEVCTMFEVVVFTASVSKYAIPVIKNLDPNGLISYCLFRNHCSSISSTFVKDLSLLGRDLSKIIIIDNSPNAYMFHPENAIPIESWIGDKSDNKLIELIPLLEELTEVSDIRTYLKDRKIHNELITKSPISLNNKKKSIVTNLSDTNLTFNHSRFSVPIQPKAPVKNTSSLPATNIYQITTTRQIKDQSIIDNKSYENKKIDIKPISHSLLICKQAQSNDNLSLKQIRVNHAQLATDIKVKLPKEIEVSKFNSRKQSTMSLDKGSTKYMNRPFYSIHKHPRTLTAECDANSLISQIRYIGKFINKTAMRSDIYMPIK